MNREMDGSLGRPALTQQPWDLFFTREIDLAPASQRRLISVFEEAEADFNRAVKSSPDRLGDHALSQFSHEQKLAPLNLPAAVKKYSQEHVETAVKEYIKKLYFEGLRAYMSTVASSTQIRASSMELYVRLLDQTFREKWPYDDWDLQLPWRTYASEVGAFIDSLPEWQHFVNAIKNRESESSYQVEVYREFHPGDFLLETLAGHSLAFQQLEADWITAQEQCVEKLKAHWKAHGWHKSKSPYHTLFYYFQQFASSVLDTYLNLSNVGVEEERLIVTARDLFIPALVNHVTAPERLPDQGYSGPSILRDIDFVNSFGFWERATAISWKTHCETAPQDRSMTVTWLLNCRLALRFPRRREIFRSTITSSLNHRLREWKAKNEQARNPPKPLHGLPSYYQKPDPLFYFRQTEILGLSEPQRRSIEAALLESHAFYIDAATNSMEAYAKILCRAYDAIAEEWQKANLLSEPALDEVIPQTVVDLSACGRWRYPPTSLQQAGAFTTEFGHVWIDPLSLSMVFQLLAGRRSDWRARLIRIRAASIGAPVSPSERQRGFPANEEDHAKVIAALKLVGSQWRKRLPEVCRQLSETGADFPSQLDLPSVHSWSELGIYLGKTKTSRVREKLMGYLKYRIRWARKAGNTNSLEVSSSLPKTTKR